MFTLQYCETKTLFYCFKQKNKKKKNGLKWKTGKTVNIVAVSLNTNICNSYVGSQRCLNWHLKALLVYVNKKKEFWQIKQQNIVMFLPF